MPLICLVLCIAIDVSVLMHVYMCVLNPCIMGCMYVWNRSISLVYSASESPFRPFLCLIPFTVLSED